MALAAGLTVNVIWVLLKDFVSAGPMLSKNPDIRGGWTGSYRENGVKYQDKIEVTQEFWKYFRGVFISDEDGSIIRYKFTGRFIYSLVLQIVTD